MKNTPSTIEHLKDYGKRITQLRSAVYTPETEAVFWHEKKGSFLLPFITITNMMYEGLAQDTGLPILNSIMPYAISRKAPPPVNNGTGWFIHEIDDWTHFAHNDIRWSVIAVMMHNHKPVEAYAHFPQQNKSLEIVAGKGCTEITYGHDDEVAKRRKIKKNTASPAVNITTPPASLIPETLQGAYFSLISQQNCELVVNYTIIERALELIDNGNAAYSLELEFLDAYRKIQRPSLAQIAAVQLLMDEYEGYAGTIFGNRFNFSKERTSGEGLIMSSNKDNYDALCHIAQALPITRLISTPQLFSPTSRRLEDLIKTEKIQLL